MNELTDTLMKDYPLLCFVSLSLIIRVFNRLLLIVKFLYRITFSFC